MFDMVGAPGVATDLSHVDVNVKVTGHGMTLKQFTGPDKIENQAEFQAKAQADALRGLSLSRSILSLS